MNKLFSQAWVMVVVSVLGGYASADTQIVADDYKPNWQIGDAWTVQTVSRLSHTSSNPSVVAKWQFRVVGQTSIGTRLQFQVGVSMISPVRQLDVVTFYADASTFSLSSVEARVRMAGRDVWLTESYGRDSGQLSPVIATMSPLPIAMPLFHGQAKGAETYTYLLTGKELLTKNAQLSFRHWVRQTIQRPDPQALHSVESIELTKSVDQPNLVEVTISDSRRVRQIWQANMPWPILTEDGTTTATLIDVQRRGGGP